MAIADEFLRNKRNAETGYYGQTYYLTLGR